MNPVAFNLEKITIACLIDTYRHTHNIISKAMGKYTITHASIHMNANLHIIITAVRKGKCWSDINTYHNNTHIFILLWSYTNAHSNSGTHV